MAKSIKREEEVVVIAGAHKGKRGKVLSVKDQSRVIVEGVNKVTKHQPKSQENPEGATVEREMSIHYSNVMLAAKFDAKHNS